MVRRVSEQETQKAKSFRPKETSSLTTGSQSTVERNTIQINSLILKRDPFVFACHCEQVLTQCVENACGQTNTQEHECPASCPQAPCLHGVELVLLLKHFLVGTKSIQQSQQLKCTTTSSCGYIRILYIVTIIHKQETNNKSIILPKVDQPVLRVPPCTESPACLLIWS